MILPGCAAVVGEQGHVLVGPPQLADHDGVAEDHDQSRKSEDCNQLKKKVSLKKMLMPM
jgi:hypothetical protein